MPWILKDVFWFIAGIASLYLLCFGTLPDKQKDQGDESRQVRVWLTYIALFIVAVAALLRFVVFRNHQ
jgi:heme/copper-type cytochrome/quinol oxidase subunit 2